MIYILNRFYAAEVVIGLEYLHSLGTAAVFIVLVNILDKFLPQVHCAIITGTRNLLYSTVLKVSA